jgi:predicted small lipoprotein YifL
LAFYRIVAFDRISRRILLAAAVTAALSLAACGRKGPLDLPPGDGPPAGGLTTPSPPATISGPAFLPGSSSAAPPATPAQTGFDAHGNPVAPPGPNKPFILDPLLR